jgi:hypothetical protein
MKATLNLLLAVVVGSLAGAIVYNYSCNSDYGNIVLPIAALLFWMCTLYPFMSGSAYGGIGLCAAALGAPRLVALCPETVDPEAGATALWNTMVAVLFAIVINVFCETLFKVGRASDLAVEGLDQAFQDVQKGFTAFWDQTDITTAITSVPGQLGLCSSFNTSADVEPRFWRNDWKVDLYADVVDMVNKLRLDLLCLEFSMEGGSGSASGLFSEFEKEEVWEKVKGDLNTTLEMARKLSVSLLGHESGEFKGLSDLDATDNIDELEDLPKLLDELNNKLEFPKDVPSTMEEDKLCKISAVLVMLE